MKQHKDDWIEHRSKGNHLKPDEIEKLHKAFRAGIHPTRIARELKCSSRIAYKWFQRFRGGSVRQSYEAKPKPSLTPRPSVDRASRFYRGSFEL